MSKTPAQPQEKYVLRLPDGMRDKIRAAAETNNRSMNAEIVARLQQSFDGHFVDPQAVEALAQDMLKEIRKQLSAKGIEQPAKKPDD